MERQGAYIHTDKLESYHRELVSMFPWLRPHLAKRSDQGSAVPIVECAMLITTRDNGDSPRTMVEDKMKPHTGGAPT